MVADFKHSSFKKPHHYVTHIKDMDNTTGSYIGLKTKTEKLAVRPLESARALY